MFGRKCLDEPYIGPALRAVVGQPCNHAVISHFYIYNHNAVFAIDFCSGRFMVRSRAV